MTTVIKVLGPPGCGKTTFLLKRFRECLSMSCINKMGYFSFSKQAAYEALERAEKVIDLTGKDRLVFSTLHSFTYRLLDLHREEVFNNHHERVFAQRMGLTRQWDNDQGVFAVTKDDRIAAIVKYATVTGRELEEVWKPFAYVIPWAEIQRYVDGLNKYKQAYNLVDFNDMILNAMHSVNIPEFDFLFIDECQDTSKIQWDFIREKLMPKTKVLYLVGDDDQTIFSFAGANSKEFIEFPCDETILLDQSYRVPAKVQEIANRVITKVQHRIPKKWKPREEKGDINRSVQVVPKLIDIKEVIRAKGEWLILARDNYILSTARNMLRNAGIYYAERRRSYGVRTSETWEPALNSEVFLAAHTYWTLRNVGYVTGTAFLNMCKYMEMSEEAQAVQDEELITYDNCPKLILHKVLNENAFSALKGIKPHDIEYLWALCQNNEVDENFILTAPRVKLATIHAVKGSECDNVVLFTDTSPQSHEGLVTPGRRDEELRIIYVGITRARRCLWIIEPQTKNTFIKELYKDIELYKEEREEQLKKGKGTRWKKQ